ncbi:MAG: hypothetical protein J6V26_05820 [Alistipes sp.]|nr:hypothetical protein [Alistipes sp.]
MKRLLLLTALTLCGLLSSERVVAQYYSWGVDSPSYRWKQMRSEKYRVVYPDTAENVANRMMYYLDAVQGDIAYGYRHPQMYIPFVVHPANSMSNGLVMWMPRRVEFLSTPEIRGYSMPWVKQLVAHEYRHAVQYNNLNRGVVKALSYVLGQQSSTIGLLFMPLWMMEGDAVMTETEMSTFGRGLQPSFTMPYRAYESVTKGYKSIDKWFCGSFKDYIPNHYQLGYLLSRHGYQQYGTVMGDDVAELTSRRPWMVVANTWVLKKLYGSSRPKLFYSTFDALEEHWKPIAEVEQTTEPIEVAEPKSYTTYSHPRPLGDGGILMLKETLDKPTAFVVVDEASGDEQHIAYTGIVSTRPALDDNGRLWWTEYRRSALFAEKVASQLCYMDLKYGKPITMRGYSNVLYPTPTKGHGMALVEYALDGRYSVVVQGTSTIARRTELPYGSEVHGMAWDDATEALYLIITDDDGMHIARLDSAGITPVTRAAYTTLSDLVAKDGHLYYGSIASGRDELHMYDLARGEEYRLSTSRYGSFQPVPVDSSYVVATSYDRRGYMPVRQSVDDAVKVEYAPHPPKMLLPEVAPWGVVNLDTVRFDDVAEREVKTKTPAKRFSRIGNAFNVHSWAPASYDPYALTEESHIAFNLGATVMSQNILSTTEGFLTWGWNQHEGSVFKGMLRYYGLGVNLWVKGVYGGTQQVYKVAVYDPQEGELVYPDEPELGRYYSVSVGATLPILLHRGYHTSQLAASASWSFSNGMVANVDDLEIRGGKVTNIHTIGYSEGVHLLNLGVSFQDNVRLAHRDFLPPWGVALAVNSGINPASTDFGHLVVLYGKVYTPGFAPHHSLSLAASYQTSIGGFHSDMVLSSLSLKSSRLIPRGYTTYDIANSNYVATSLNYQAPVWYPDGGIRGIIYFKRLRLNVGADYASFDNRVVNPESGLIGEQRKSIGSYGLDLGVDFNLFTMPDSATISATFSLYRKVELVPFKDGKFHFSFGLGLPF